MGGDQVGAVGRAIERHLAFSAATWSADFFALRGAKSLGPPFGTNCAGRPFGHLFGSRQSSVPEDGEGSQYIRWKRFEPAEATSSQGCSPAGRSTTMTFAMSE